MARQLWLADVLRAAGLKVVEESGWKTRSAAEDEDASDYSPRGVIIHETRGSATSTDAAEIGVLINGRVGLSGPIAQLYLSRTGVWHVIAAGLCHHVKTGWGGPFAGLGNSRLLGIEAQHGEAEDWASKPVQYAAYVAGVAAILRHTGWPAPVGHKEHQPGDKPDPEFSMPAFRAAVAAEMEEDMLTPEDVRHQAALALYDVLWVAATGQTANGLVYAGQPGAIGAAVKGNLQALTVAPILAGLRALDAVDETKLAAALAPAVAQAVVASLPEGESVTVEALTEAMRRVLGSLDGATPQG